jgi:hypothetical protein
LPTKLNLTPGDNPKENIQDSEHGETLKSRILHLSAKLNLTPGENPKENTQDSEHGETLKSRILHLYGEDIANRTRCLEKLCIKFKSRQNLI